MKHLFLISTFLLLQFVGKASVDFNANKTAGCPPLLVFFADISVHPKVVQSKTWYWGDATAPIATSVDTFPHAFINSGTYCVKLVVLYTDGTKDSTTKCLITVYNKPVINFTVSDSILCGTGSVCFTNLSTPGSGTMKKMLMEISNGTHWKDSAFMAQTGGNFCHTYAAGGSYAIYAFAESNYGCKSDTTFPWKIHVYNKPSLNFTGTPLNTCDTVITPSFSPSPALLPTQSVNWVFDNNLGTSTAINPSFTFYRYQNTPFDVQMKYSQTYHGGLLTCYDSVKKVGYVNLRYSYNNFDSSSKRRVCLGSSVSVKDTTFPLGTSVYDWGDGTPKSASPHTYSAPGTYSVKQFVTFPSGCKDSSFKLNLFTVDPIPKAAFRVTSDSVFCKPPATISLMNQSYNHTSQTWTFTGGTPSITTSTIDNPTVTFNGAGSAKLVVSNLAGCKDSITKSIVIFPGIKALFTASKTKGCLNDTITFTNTSYGLLKDSIVAYMWDFNEDGVYDSVHSSKRIVKWRYDAVGCKKVMLVVVGQSGCTDTMRMSICANTKPTASYKMSPKNVCAGTQVTLIYTGTPVKKTTWYYTSLNALPTGANTTLDSPFQDTFRFKPTTKGKYKPALVVSNDGCLDTALILPEYDSLMVTGAGAGTISDSLHCSNRKRVFFKSSTTNANRVLWDFGNSASTTDTSSLKNPNYIYPLKGCYTVRLVAYNDTVGCTDTVTKEVCVYQPILSFTAVDTVTCRYQPITFTNTSDFFQPNLTVFSVNGCTPFSGANAIYGSPTLFPGYWADGTYSIGMQSTDPNGCIDTMCNIGYIKITSPHPAFFLNKDVSVCQGTSIKITEKSTTSSAKPIAYKEFRIFRADNSELVPVFFDSIKTIVFPELGTFRIRLVVSDGVCVKDTNVFINVYDPQAQMHKDLDSVCPDYPVTFTNDLIEPGIDYKWYFKNADIDSFIGQTPPAVSFSTQGRHVVMLVASYGTLACRDTAWDTVTVYRPKAKFTQDVTLANCGPQLVTFCNTSIGSNITEWCYDWNDPYDTKTGFSDCFTDSAHCAVHNFKYSFVYPVCLRVKTIHGCMDTFCSNVTIKGPQLTYTYQVLDSCGSANIKFVLSSKYACSINLIPPPSGTTNPINHCDTFCGVDGKPNCIDTFTCNFTNPGPHPFQIIVVDKNNTCFGIFDFGPFNVYTPPVAKMELSDSSICRYNSISFTDSSTYTNGYFKNKWTFHNGKDTFKTASNYYPNPGSYPVKLVVEDTKGCKDSISQSITVNQKPVATFTSKDVCLGNSTPFTYTSVDTNVNYLWEFGVIPMVNDISKNPKYTYPTAGSDSVTLMIEDANGCMDTVGNWVKIFSAPIADFDSSGFCVGLSTSFKNKSTTVAPNFFIPTKYAHWDYNYPSSDTANTDDGNHSYAPQGNYNVFLKVKDNQGCVDSIVKVVTINASPLAQFTVTPAKTCFGAPILFKDMSIPTGGPLTGWEWDTDGNGLIDKNSQNIAPVSFSPSGNYYPTLIVTDANGCKDTATNSIVIVDKPIIDFSSNASHCKDSLFYFTNTSPNIGAISSWEWYFGEDAGPNDFALNSIHAYPFSDTYKVKLIAVDSIGCRDTVEHMVKVDEPPIIVRINPEFNPVYICEGEVLTVKVAGAERFTWDNDPYVTLIDGDTVVLIATPISKKFRFRGVNGSCPEVSDHIDVRIIPARPVTVTVKENYLIKGQSTQVKASYAGSQVGDVVLQWSPPESILNPLELETYVTPYTTTYYKAKITYQKMGKECTSEDSVLVTVSDSCTLADLHMPYSFTPGEATNNRLYPAGPALESVEFFKVFDRWGNKIFETAKIRANDPLLGWDGRQQSCQKEMEAGVYIYQIGVRCKNGNLICVNRDVTLLR
jgi:PKD repeat protein